MLISSKKKGVFVNVFVNFCKKSERQESGRQENHFPVARFFPVATYHIPIFVRQECWRQEKTNKKNKKKLKIPVALIPVAASRLFVVVFLLVCFFFRHFVA